MITVENLQFSYPKTAVPTLHGLNFSIKPGEIFGFLGPSGAGKSTTQKIAIGLLKSYQGRVAVFGREVADWGADYYERIGVSFELPNHYLKLTAVENLTYFAALYRRAAYAPQELLSLVGLADEGHLPVGQFSKGMKNRLTLARALLHDPELLFLDEPTSGLDPVNARRVRELIKGQQAAGKTIFLTTHDMAVAEALCDRVAFIVDGRIELIDTPQRLKLEYGEPLVEVNYLVDGNGRCAQQSFPLAGLADNNAFQTVLRQHPVQTIHSQEATLEEIFIRVTGRSLA
jgi:fluoroquinolone transport system ATP-binding protein